MAKRKAKLELLSEYIEKNAKYYIELCLAFALFAYGLAVALPWNVATVNSIVEYGWPRATLGMCLALPSVFLLSLRITGGLYEYIYKHQKRRRAALFLIFVCYVYLGVLSFAISLFPPGFMFYFALAAISLIAYLRLGR